MSWKDSVTIILSLSVPVLLALITYTYQEKQKRRAALSEQRQALYEKLIRSLIELLGADTAEERSRLMSDIERGWLFASDDVLKACCRYVAAYNEVCCSATDDDALDWGVVMAKVRSDPVTREKLRDPLAAVFAGMRRDIGRKTTITDDWACEHLDIYRWGVVSTDGQMLAPR